MYVRSFVMSIHIFCPVLMNFGIYALVVLCAEIEAQFDFHFMKYSMLNL